MLSLFCIVLDYLQSGKRHSLKKLPRTLRAQINLTWLNNIPTPLDRLQSQIFFPLVHPPRENYIRWNSDLSLLYYQDSYYCFDMMKTITMTRSDLKRRNCFYQRLIHRRSKPWILSVAEVTIWSQSCDSGVQMEVETTLHPQKYRRLQALIIPLVRPYIRITQLETLGGSLETLSELNTRFREWIDRT